MMKILTIILVLSLIGENKANGKNGLDVLELQMLIDSLDDDILEDKIGLENTVLCSGMEYLDCYSKLLEVYEKNIEHDVAKAINESILKKLTSYNDLVLLLFTKIEESQEELASERISADTLIDYIRFENSNVYCVVDFLRRFGITPNDKLKNSIFFSDPKILNKKNITNFEKLKELIFDSFEPYDKYLRLDQKFIGDDFSSLEAIKLLETVKNLLGALRQDIVNFSIPFCNTQLPHIKEDSWTWKKLQNSTLLSQKLQNSDSLMDWEDLKSNDSQNQQAKDDFKESFGTINPPSRLLRDHLSYSLLDLWEITEKTFKEDETALKIEKFVEMQIDMPAEKTVVNTNEFEDLQGGQQQIVMSAEETAEDENEFEDQHNRQQRIGNPVEEAAEDAYQFEDLLNNQKSDSLNKMFEKLYNDYKFDQVDTFYNDVVATIDAYVTKVLFCRVLHLVSGVLISYFEVVSAYKSKHIQILIDNYFRKILNFGYELEMFLITLEMYIDQQLLTLDSRTTNDMYVKLLDARARYINHIFKMNDPAQSVNIIRRHLEDQRFHRDSNDLKFADYTSVEKSNELLEDSFDELLLININFVHIIEVKMIPTEPYYRIRINQVQ